MNIKNIHNVEYGILDRCQITNEKNLELVADFGNQPLCDTLLEEKQLNKQEKFYPLRLYRSPTLGHGQLDFIVPANEVYHPDYPYRPGITQEVHTHHKKRCNETIEKFNLNQKDLVLDIGSNDGTLLSYYKKKNIRVLGVEPTNTYKFALKERVETLNEFFDEKIAKDIIANYQIPKIITATNVFAHMAALGSFMAGIRLLLDKQNFFIFENHYIVNILNENQYDSIYHEHIRSYSLKSLEVLFEMYDMKILDCEVVDRYGGSIRVIVSDKSNNFKVSNNVSNLLKFEKNFGLFDQKVWENFSLNVKKTKEDLMNLALDAKENGKRLVGKSCPGRCSTLINYVGLDKTLMPYISEQNTSLKLGKYLPGKHIPIVSDDILLKDNPDYIIIFAWHYGTEIIQYLKKMGLKSKFILPLPNVKII